VAATTFKAAFIVGEFVFLLSSCPNFAAAEDRIREMAQHQRKMREH
jgi:hypothetical protein